jgi:ATP-dependent protease ClpP protease subunit
MQTTILNKPKSSFGYDDWSNEFEVSFTPHKSGEYTINIDGDIQEVRQFTTAIRVLNLATEQDEITINLQTNGGSLDAGGALLHAMQKCVADIHIIATGGVHSMGTHILLAADSFELADNFSALIHNGSSGAGGNLNEYHAKSDFDKQFIRKQHYLAYEGFLTEDEFELLMIGQNIWLDAESWCERFEQRNQYFADKNGETVKQLDNMKIISTNLDEDSFVEDTNTIEESLFMNKPKKK